MVLKQNCTNLTPTMKMGIHMEYQEEIKKIGTWTHEGQELRKLLKFVGLRTIMYTWPRSRIY